MHLNYCFFGEVVAAVRAPRRLSSARGFRFVERDLDILEFTLQMKFADLELLHEKFFSVTNHGQASSSVTWARQRIQNLLKSGLLEKVDLVFRRPLLTVTQKGYFYLQNCRPLDDRPRPLLSVDGKTFEHDRLVSRVRIALEKSREATSWTSERALFESETVSKILTADYRPDGIYTDAMGRRVAFELELSRKSKERYSQKIRRYIQLMTGSEKNFRPFSAVHYLVQKPQVFEILKTETQIYHTHFKIQMLSEVIAGETL